MPPYTPGAPRRNTALQEGCVLSACRSRPGRREACGRGALRTQEKSNSKFSSSRGTRAAGVGLGGLGGRSHPGGEKGRAALAHSPLPLPSNFVGGSRGGTREAGGPATGPVTVVHGVGRQAGRRSRTRWSTGSAPRRATARHWGLGSYAPPFGGLWVPVPGPALRYLRGARWGSPMKTAFSMGHSW
jgi:hypothetical protein